MNLSFSTKGWNSLSWQELLDEAVENEFQGIEVFDPVREGMDAKDGPFHKYTAAATLRSLKEKKQTISAFDTSYDLSSKDSDPEEIKTVIGLARAMEVPYVSFPVSSDDEKTVIEKLDELLPAAREAGIVLLIKTIHTYNDTGKLAGLLDRYACDELGALWEVNSTIRRANETPEQTVTNLGAYIKHVHIYDSDDDNNYNLVGEGTLPMDDIVNALDSLDYDGFVSLQWQPKWLPDLTDPEIIFPHFVNYMERYKKETGRKSALFLNHDGTGEYVWKKEELIDLTFPQVLDRMVEEFPDQYAFKYTTLDYTRTYTEFRKDVDDFARALMSMGVKPGSKVAIWATNVPAWFITFWATTKIGAVLVTVNTAYKIHEAEYLLRQSDTHTLVMVESALDSNYRQIINELCPEIEKAVPGEPLHCKKLPFLRNVITVGFEMKGCLTFDEVFDRAERVPLDEMLALAAKVKPDDVCNMQYTSGTTGFPKGVMLTHYNVVNNGKCIGDRLGLSTADRMMIQVPMFHCFGMVLSMTASVTHGTTMSPMPYFSAKSSLACINAEKITCFNGVPTMFIAMFNHKDYRTTDFSHMRTGIMAGSGCPPELMRRAADPNEMHMIGITSVYGQTETAPGNTQTEWTDPLDMRCDTVGYAFAHVQCKVVDPETGLEVPNGVNGEFCAKGYNQMKGYYKMPGATAETIDKDGWLHSGDLACRADDGTFKITGRIKDMIIRGGENLYPKEIEEFIYTHEGVQDVQVVGVPDEKYGEEAMAYIILKKGVSITEDEMMDYIKARLARHKVPKYIEFVDSFPMNAAGKVLKYKMREMAKEKYGL